VVGVDNDKYRVAHKFAQALQNVLGPAPAPHGASMSSAPAPDHGHKPQGKGKVARFWHKGRALSGKFRRHQRPPSDPDRPGGSKEGETGSGRGPASGGMLCCRRTVQTGYKKAGYKKIRI
jgi:hypothetical protein